MLFVHFIHLSISFHASHKTAFSCFTEALKCLLAPQHAAVTLFASPNLCKLIKLKCWWWKFSFSFSRPTWERVLRRKTPNWGKHIRMGMLSIRMSGPEEGNRWDWGPGSMDIHTHLHALSAHFIPKFFGRGGTLMWMSNMINWKRRDENRQNFRQAWKIIACDNHRKENPEPISGLSLIEMKGAGWWNE